MARVLFLFPLLWLACTRCPPGSGPPVPPSVQAKPEAPAKPAYRDARARRVADGLRVLVTRLESGELGANQALELIATVEAQVGPPDVSLPPLELTCTADSECGLVWFELDGPQVCCASRIATAGTKRSIDRAVQTCVAERWQRGNLSVRDLPWCAPITGPVSANVSRCERGRCVAGMAR